MVNIAKRDGGNVPRVALRTQKCAAHVFKGICEVFETGQARPPTEKGPVNHRDPDVGRKWNEPLFGRDTRPACPRTGRAGRSSLPRRLEQGHLFSSRPLSLWAGSGCLNQFSAKTESEESERRYLGPRGGKGWFAGVFCRLRACYAAVHPLRRWGDKWLPRQPSFEGSFSLLSDV